MSNNVIHDIPALKEYKRKLSASRTQQAELMQRMKRDLDQIGSSWKDQQYTQYRSVLEQRMQATNRFVGELDATLKYIDGLIQKLEAVASHRM